MIKGLLCVLSITGESSHTASSVSSIGAHGVCGQDAALRLRGPSLLGSLIKGEGGPAL